VSQDIPEGCVYRSLPFIKLVQSRSSGDTAENSAFHDLQVSIRVTTGKVSTFPLFSDLRLVVCLGRRQMSSCFFLNLLTYEP
jgi:hypothetical protein